MLILGATRDDKGAQLEQLVHTILERQGYKAVRSNVVGAGGNELDVLAARESPIVGAVQITRVLCEAKAYADPVDMPIWQRFLGKLFIERSKKTDAVGILVALNGINGNVAGSYDDLRSKDSALFVFEGSDLLAVAIESKQVAQSSDVTESAKAQFGKLPSRIEVAYYGGAFYWVVHWNEAQYSVIDGHGQMLLAEDVEGLRPALEATVSGTLLATDEARAEVEQQHLSRLRVINDLFHGNEIRVETNSELSSAIASLVDEPFTQVEEGRLLLRPAAELDAASIARLFVAMLENVVKVPLLSFMIDGLHSPYIARLVEVIPEIQAGFSLAEEESRSLEQFALVFPSVWLTLASPIPMITMHRTNEAELGDDATLAADRMTFWETIVNAIRSDYGNARLHGFLYDYMNVAELEQRVELTVKTKTGPLGLPILTETRDAVRQFADDSIGDAGPVYVMVRLLTRGSDPWEDGHPEPAYPLV